MKYDTFIFDLDGTLLDTLEDLWAAVNYALQENGYPLRRMDEVRAFIGNGVVELMKRALGGKTKDLDKALADFKRYYGEHCAEKTGLYEGIEEVLFAIKRAGKKVAVVSNKADFAVKLLAKRYFEGLIEVAIGENEASGVKKKPAPDSVYAALEALGSSAEGAVYIGDSEVDLETAKNAGLPCISVSWGMKTKEFLLSRGAEIILEKATELLTYI